MGKFKKLILSVNGKFIDSGAKRYNNACDPSTGEIIVEISCCTSEEVKSAITSTKTFFFGWSSTLAAKHVRILLKARKLIVKKILVISQTFRQASAHPYDGAKGNVRPWVQLMRA